MIDGQAVIDFHGHCGRWDSLGGTDNISEYLHAMDAAGIDRSVLFEIFDPAGRPGNEHLAEWMAPHADRFIGFAYVSPLCPQTMTDVLTHAVDTLGFRGIKLYPPYIERTLDDACWEPVYEFADQRGLPIISHTGVEPSCHPDQWHGVVDRFPRATFICAHAGNIQPIRDQAIRLARTHPNVMVETASSFRTPGVIEELVDTVGSDRILFGSDTPVMDPRIQLGKILTADIPDDAKRMITGGNAIKLLGL